MNLNKLKKTFIIAEIGNNHEGSFDIACKLIKEAKKTGVDAVKFQTFKTEDFITPNDKERFKRLKKFELSYEQFVKLSVIAKKNDLKFISTPLDIKSAYFLNNIVDCFKIASGDNNYYNLIKTVLNFNKTTFISTGLLDFFEVKNLLKFIYEPNDELTYAGILEEIRTVTKRFMPKLTFTQLKIEQSDESEYAAVVTMQYVVTEGVFETTDIIVIKL